MSDNLLARLNQFALTLDYIDKNVLYDIEGFFYDIVIGGLNACYYELCIEAPGSSEEDNKFLTTLWCSIEDRRNTTAQLYRDDGSVYSQKAYIYSTGHPIWITPQKTDETLADCSSIEQLNIDWTDCDNLPDYRNYKKTGESKTSIVIPLRFQKEIFGVLDIEFEECKTYCNAARSYIKKLAETISTILGRYISSTSSFGDTRYAFKTLRNEVSISDIRLPGDDLPTIFFAYPEDSDDAVVGNIIALLENEYSKKLSLIDWKSISDPGPINKQIIDSIKNSDFGLCYLSENNKSSDDFKYKDNQNVLFEAGMLHMLHKNRSDELHGWLPIRESENLAGKIPFDFAGDRVLIVPRQASGALNEPLFKEKFSSHLNAALGLD